MSRVGILIVAQSKRGSNNIQAVEGPSRVNAVLATWIQLPTTSIPD